MCILQVIYLGYNLEEGKQMLSHDYFSHPAKLPHKEKKVQEFGGGAVGYCQLWKVGFTELANLFYANTGSTPTLK